MSSGNAFLEQRMAFAEEAKSSKVEERRRLWMDIQAKAPHLAKTLVEANQVFGKGQVSLSDVVFFDEGE